ncbi:Neu5Ac permease [Tritonibacter multivorans]|uniref:Neu5Ac permease n=1 Tax=Tritonibacter multivorans TaxID=928856 RepID=A0A0P1GB50_9RHOB|nr:TRAP transporter large permease subunit [Tritonibacter multivorans]MDA7421986.1 TRAP transporter large permease subunit [Tritonibacter multivorans]CUH78723.1 Neu5Ac permease [Tritonibacter multivorans]SFD68032.1 TRAP transporter, DctM subunit [Tritonibacter multivorans]
MIEYLDVLMFAALIAAVLSGFPVAFSIAGVAVLFAYFGWAMGAMDISLLGAFGQRVFGLISNQVLIAIPLFVLMGALLEKSRIAEELLVTMARAFGQLRGGLGIAVILVGTLLAASTGIVGATVVAMGMIALPTMLRAGYDPKVASGIVCTAGTLGQIIPPSTLLIILADVMSNAYQQAQYEQGKFSVEALSVGQFFAAALIPGLVLVSLYLTYVLARGVLRPQDMPPADQRDGRPSLTEVLSAIAPPVLLIFAVLGSILGGLATPTEAASVGAIGALLMTGVKLGRYTGMICAAAIALLVLAVAAGVAPVRLQRDDLSAGAQILGAVYIGLALVGLVGILAALRSALSHKVLHDAATSTLTMTAMIFATILAAGMFSLVFIGLGGEERVAHWLENLPGGATGALLVTMLIVFVLGFFLDFVEISVIVLPLVAPTLILLGHDPIWLGILLAINLQTSFLTPPFGFSLFYLRGAAPAEVTTGHIYRGVTPFIGLQAIGVLAVWFWPALATWLPAAMF